jgi:uncharacterized membrane protein
MSDKISYSYTSCSAYRSAPKGVGLVAGSIIAVLVVLIGVVVTVFAGLAALSILSLVAAIVAVLVGAAAISGLYVLVRDKLPWTATPKS